MASWRRLSTLVADIGYEWVPASIQYVGDSLQELGGPPLTNTTSTQVDEEEGYNAQAESGLLDVAC